MSGSNNKNHSKKEFLENPIEDPLDEETKKALSNSEPRKKLHTEIDQTINNESQRGQRRSNKKQQEAHQEENSSDFEPEDDDDENDDRIELDS